MCTDFRYKDGVENGKQSNNQRNFRQWNRRNINNNKQYKHNHNNPKHEKDMYNELLCLKDPINALNNSLTPKKQTKNINTKQSTSGNVINKAVVINDNAKRLHMETSSLDNDLGIEEFEKKLEASNKQVQQNTTILQDAASKLTYTLDDDVELED
ncbi:uncharacterized protein OCT59_020681 [Rhizophagus irregularis]|uniref:uncharacterized protein n=1 Tax=Rhizophagus irregularis TaxID=588596 RepID=UPI00333396B4|nr:hypothetical protein OCT59_020681 [Rhizophagus irregularis]